MSTKKNFAIGNLVKMNGKIYVVTCVKKMKRNHVRVMELDNPSEKISEEKVAGWRAGDDSTEFAFHPGVPAHVDALEFV